MTSLLERGSAKLDLEIDLTEADINSKVCDECHMMIPSLGVCGDCNPEVVDTITVNSILEEKEVK